MKAAGHGAAAPYWRQSGTESLATRSRLGAAAAAVGLFLPPGVASYRQKNFAADTSLKMERKTNSDTDT